MRKLVSMLLVIVFAAMILAGCSPSSLTAPVAPTSAPAGNKTDAPQSNAKPEAKTVKVAVMLNGLLGDKGLLDSAADGVKRAANELPGLEVKVIEAGYDASKWEATLVDLSEQDYDVIITGLYSMKEYINKYAPQYPNIKYIVFDTTPKYAQGNLTNVHSITYRQNECAFLAGALAALVDGSDMPLAKKSGIVSVVGGVDSPVINDFVVGFIQGAKYVNPDIKVLNAYIGSVSDAPKCKDVSLQMYSQGSSVNFSPSGGAVMGSLDAAKQAGQYVIGVDADQAMQFLESNPDLANLVISSALKNVGQSLYLALKSYLKGELEFGTGEVMGIKEGAVGLARNEVYLRVVPKDIQKRMDAIEADILSGKIEVKSAFSMTPDELNAIRAK